MNITEFAMFKKMVGKGGNAGGDNVMPICNVSFWDDEGNGPFNISYKGIENGSIVNNNIFTSYENILAVQGTEIYIETKYKLVFEDINGDINLTVSYTDGGAYITVPETANIQIWIHS
jgi:hypothetical protein